MRIIIASALATWLLGATTIMAQSKADKCHVYVIDVKATEQFRDKTDFDEFAKKSKEEQEAILQAAGVGKTFDEFDTKVGEEELTTKTYPLLKTGQTVTASVFYTDESLASSGGQHNSMLVGVAISSKPLASALDGPDAAVAEVTYDSSTDVVRAKKFVVVGGRSLVVGIECRCKQAAKR